MTDAELAEIEKACAEASPGPWKVASDEDALSVVCATGTDYEIATVIQRRAGAEANANLLAGARAWVPALIDEVRRLREALDAPEDCFEHAGNCCSEWCEGCKEGVRGAAVRESALKG